VKLTFSFITLSQQLTDTMYIVYDKVLDKSNMNLKEGTEPEHI